MTLTALQWHQRFLQQAQWTSDLRRYIYREIDQFPVKSILDVGCGTGALLDEFLDFSPTGVHGLDINLEFLSFSRGNNAQAKLTCGDARTMPYAADSFDMLVCHYLLLWVNDPGQVLAEMVRVANAGATIVALAEPDYGGRIDYPEALSTLGDRQKASLRSQGADTHMGRKLRALFSQAGLEGVETGVLGGQWKGPVSPEERASEWSVLANDLEGLIEDEDIEALMDLEAAAWEAGERVLYVPTFYAMGRVGK